MVNKLEEIKKLGAYAVTVHFGGDIGWDDMDVPTEERNITVYYVPVGGLGEKRNMWRGKYKEFLAFDFSSEPKRISNPPEHNEYKDGGFFTWGCY